LGGFSMVSADMNCAEKIMEEAWEVRNLSNNLLDSKESRNLYTEAQADYVRKSRQCAREMVQAGEWQEFSDFYKTLDDVNKESLHFVVEGIISEAFYNDEASAELLKGRGEDYFPGYGYGKPGYTYRKGQELEREHLYAYWQDEEITEENAMEKELMMDVKLVIKLQIALGEEFLQELGKFEILIDEEIHMVSKVKISKKVTMKTKQKRKFAYEKVWFELWEAQKKWFGSLDWKKVGKTFQFDRMPTGEDVIIAAEIIE
jgi:hypothetical protein